MSHIATLPNRKVVFTTQQGVVLMLNFSEQGSLERAYDSRLTPQWGEIFEPSGIYGVHYVETHDNLDVVALVVGAARLHMRLIFIDSRTGDRVNTPRQIYKFDSNGEGHLLIADTTRMTITGVTSFHQNACLAVVVSNTEHSHIFVLDKVVHIATQPTWKPRVCVTFDRVVSAVATNAEHGLVGVLVQASRVGDAPVGMTVSGSRIDIKLPISTNSFFMDFNATSELGFVNLPYVFTSCLRTGPRYADITAVSPTGDIISVELASSSPTTVGTSLPTSSPANRVGLITATSHTGFPVHFATPVKISCATTESHRLVALVANTLQVFTRAYALQPFEFEFSMTLEPSDHITTLHMLDDRTIMLHTRTGIKFIKI